MRRSIRIPVHHEERTIAEVLRRVIAVDAAGFDKEIIVCDGGSLVHHPQNRGKGAAVPTALERAGGD